MMKAEEQALALEETALGVEQAALEAKAALEAGGGGGAIGWALDDAEGATRLADGSLDLSSLPRFPLSQPPPPPAHVRTPPPRLWVARARARRSSR